MNQFESAEGFSLLEILVVISIMALLSSIAMPRYMVYKEKAKAATCLTQRKKVEEVLTLYVQENPNKPIPSLGELVNGEFLTAEPRCLSGGVYLWKISEKNDLPNLFCSVHAYPGYQASLSSAASDSTTTDTSTPATTTTNPSSKPGRKPDVPPGRDPASPPGLRK